METEELAILHVEDDPNDAVLIERQLKRKGVACHIRCVHSRDKFLDALKSEKFDLILSDYTIPGFDGIAALELAKTITPDTPFIFLSGTIGEERAVSILKQGAADYVLKDNPARLPSIIERTLREARLTRERRKAESALLETQHFIERITETVPDVLYVFDIAARRTLYTSGKIETVLGYEPRESGAAVALFPDLVHPADLPATEAFLSAFSRCKDDEILELDTRLQHATKGWRWYGIRGTVFARAPGGQATQILGTICDITDRKQAEKQLRKQAALLDIARDAILILDFDLNIRFWNQGAEILYGWSPKQILGKPHDTLFPDIGETIAAIRKSVFEQGGWSGEMRQLTKDDRRVIVHSRWSLAPGSDEDSPSILVINTDVTERKELEAQFLRAQRLESIGALAGGIAHDLNNVLAPILIGAEILRSKAGEEDAKVLDAVLNSTRRGSDLIRQVLTFARGDHRKVGSVQINEILEEVESMTKETFDRSIAVSRECDLDLWQVRGDITQIHQILLNLCVNARDAMPDGGRLHLKARNFEMDETTAESIPDARPGLYVAFSVSDTGIGIDEDVRARIFEPFFTTKDASRGTGLGLATVRSLVKAHDGLITLESTPGKGATFTVFLPAVQGDQRRGSSENTNAATARGNGELILIIDDESTIVDIVSETLQSYGYSVISAGDGAEGLTLFSERADDIAAVITDTNMPAMDGPTAVANLRQLTPDLPILATAGFLQDDDAKEFARLGVTRILRKPFTSQQLLTSLRAALDA